MPLGTLFQGAGLVQQKQVSPFPRRFNMCTPWAWHHWKAWEKERLQLPLRLVLHALASSIVTLLAYLTGQWGYEDSYVQRGERAAPAFSCNEWHCGHWGGCELQPLVAPLHGWHPEVPSGVMRVLGAHALVCLILTLQDEPRKLLFGYWEELSWEWVLRRGQQEQSTASSWVVPLNTARPPLASCVAYSSLVHVHRGEEWHARKFPASWL